MRPAPRRKLREISPIFKAGTVRFHGNYSRLEKNGKAFAVA
jgi:hypothetical protein